MINRSFLAFSLYGKRVALKQQFTVYLNWFSFAPKTWKQGTLKNLVYRTYNICSTESFEKAIATPRKNVYL